MPRIVFYGFPVRGHTTPSLPVVAELARRGVDVHYHSIRAFQGLIEGTDARFTAYPPDPDGLLEGPADTGEHLARTLAAARSLLPALLTAAEAQAPDLVMFDASALWGDVIARRLGRRSVASITTFAMTRAMLQMLNTPPMPEWGHAILRQVNADHDANFTDQLDLMTPRADLKLVYTSRTFQPAGRFLDESHLFLGPLLDRRPRTGDRARAAGQRPLAYVSLGTIFNRDRTLLHVISQALATRGWQVIVSLGDASAVERRPWPEHVQAHSFVDQIGVLSQAQLFVTHGGMNSVSEAIAQAVPMIIVPQAVDQHFVARQASNLGAAVVIERDMVSADSMAAALLRIENERAAFDAAATRLQQSFAETTSLASAVDQVLALIVPERGR
jgi:MGT family glycosyltransferase